MLRINYIVIMLACMNSCSEPSKAYKPEMERKDTNEEMKISSVEMLLSPSKKRIIDQYLRVGQQPDLPSLMETFGVPQGGSNKVTYLRETGVIYLKGDDEFIALAKECIELYDEASLDSFIKLLKEERVNNS